MVNTLGLPSEEKPTIRNGGDHAIPEIISLRMQYGMNMNYFPEQHL